METRRSHLRRVHSERLRTCRRHRAQRGSAAVGQFEVRGNRTCRKRPAGSTGRCNTGLEFTRRSFKAQGLSRALIEAQSYHVEIGLRVAGQVGFLGEVHCLSRPFCIFIGAACCQGLCGSQKVDFLTFVSTVKLLCFCHLVPPVPGQRAPQGRGEFTHVLAPARRRPSLYALLGTLTSMVKRECRSTRGLRYDCSCCLRANRPPNDRE